MMDEIDVDVFTVEYIHNEAFIHIGLLFLQ